MASTAPEASLSPLKRLAQWWQDVTAAPLAIQIGKDEATKIAAEAGLTVSDLETVRREGAAAAYPMYRRLVSVGLDERELVRTEPAVLQDLQRVCSLCNEKSECLHALKKAPADTAWQSYCPNMPTFDALKAEREG